jgi:simple sugar transport system permease protein
VSVQLRLERRQAPLTIGAALVPAGSLLLSLLLGAAVLAQSGRDPLAAYGAMFAGAFGSGYAISETIVKAIPLFLCALSVLLGFRMGIWNIGAEGQLHMGAVAATWAALTFADLHAAAILPLVVIAGFAGGALWALPAALLRGFLGVNEIITTLMLNYVGILFMNYLLTGPFRDPHTGNFPYSPRFPESVDLPTLLGTRVHLGLLLGIAVAVVLAVVLPRTRLGYEIRVIGKAPGFARYAGLNIARNVVLVLVVSGGIAGLAGMGEVAGITHRLQMTISPGYGYTAIIIAWLARLNIAAVAVVTLLFAALLMGNFAIQVSGVPSALATILHAAMLFFVLAGNALTAYRVRVLRGAPASDHVSAGRGSDETRGREPG